MKTFNDGLEWAAKWIEDTLGFGETNERTIEFGKNMAMTIRAAKEPDTAPAPIAGDERCVRCGHNNASPDDGLCDELLPIVKKEPFGSEMCGCKCVFTPSAKEAEGQEPCEHGKTDYCFDCVRKRRMLDEAGYDYDAPLESKDSSTQSEAGFIKARDRAYAEAEEWRKERWARMDSISTNPPAQSGTEIPEPDAETLIKQWRNTLTEGSIVTDEDAEDLLLRVIAYANRDRYRSTAGNVDSLQQQLKLADQRRIDILDDYRAQLATAERKRSRLAAKILRAVEAQTTVKLFKDGTTADLHADSFKVDVLNTVRTTCAAEGVEVGNE